jgi:membrane protease YdiL (CAAX protease family)
LDTRLSVAKRIGLTLVALIGLWTATRFAAPALTPARPGDQDFLYRLYTIAGLFVSAAWTALTGWAALWGMISRTHRPWIITTTLAMGFLYLVMFMLIFAAPLAREESRALFGTQLLLAGFFLLNTIGLCIILGVLYRGQFRSQEKLLEIQYRLADLTEKIEKPHGR